MTEAVSRQAFRRFAWASLLWAGGLTAVNLWLTVQYAGRIEPPLDDAYIHYVFARAIAEGRWFEYVPGEGYTRGATSFLYPLLLALPLALGLPSEWLRVAAPALGGVLYGLSAWGVFAWIARLTRRSDLAGWAGLFYLACGTLHWGALSGMEIALFAALLAGSLAALPGPPPAPIGARFLALASLLAMVRPEGAITAGVMSLMLAAQRLRGRRVAQALGLVLPCVAGAVKPAMDWWHTGSIVPTGFYAKAAFATRMAGGKRWDAWETIYNGLLGIRFRLDWFGGQYAEFLHGLVWLAVLAGAARLARLARRNGEAMSWWAGVVPVVAASLVLCFVLPVGDWQYNRYFLHFLVVYVPLMALGVLAVDERLGARRALAGGVLAMSLLTVPYWSQILARSSREILQHHVALERWMERQLPSGARIAVNEAGFAAWYGNWRIVDLFGLVSRGYEGPKPFSIWERLEALPPDARPDYFVVYPHWFPQLFDAGFLTEIATIHLGGELVAVGNDMSVCRAHWDRVGQGDRPIELDTSAWDLIDRLDVADPPSERAHAYRRRPVLRDDPSLDWTYEFQWGDRTAIDAGYFIRGTERFRMAARPGRDLFLAVRYYYAYHDHSPIYVDVVVDGRPAGTWRFTPWVTMSRDGRAPDVDGWWFKDRTGDLFLDTGQLTTRSQLLLDLQSGPVPAGERQIVRVADAFDRPLAEDALTSGERRTLTVAVGSVPRAGQPGYTRLSIAGSYRFVPDLMRDPTYQPAHPVALRLLRVGLRDGDGPDAPTLWREMRTFKTSRTCESVWRIPADLIRRTPVEIEIRTNPEWSENYHNSFHYWAFVPREADAASIAGVAATRSAAGAD